MQPWLHICYTVVKAESVKAEGKTVPSTIKKKKKKKYQLSHQEEALSKKKEIEVDGRFICMSAMPLHPLIGLFENHFPINQHLWLLKDGRESWGKLVNVVEQLVR